MCLPTHHVEFVKLPVNKVVVLDPIFALSILQDYRGEDFPK
jgi:hypothetical protein